MSVDLAEEYRLAAEAYHLEAQEAGKHIRAIALRLKRSESSIRKRANELDVKIQKNPRYLARDLGRESPI